MSSQIDWETKKTSWITQVTNLFATIRTWADEQGWLVGEQKKTLQEEHLGTYIVPTLVLKTPQGRITVEPIGRNVIGAEGRIDICLFPSFARFLLVRIDNQWVIKTDSGVSWPSSWGKNSFLGMVETLSAAA